MYICVCYVYVCNYIYSEEIGSTKDCTWIGRQAGELLGSLWCWTAVLRTGVEVMMGGRLRNERLDVSTCQGMSRVMPKFCIFEGWNYYLWRDGERQVRRVSVGSVSFHSIREQQAWLHGQKLLWAWMADGMESKGCAAQATWGFKGFFFIWSAWFSVCPSSPPYHSIIQCGCCKPSLVPGFK